MKIINKINKKIAAKITNIVGSMWCAYLFAIIALISLPAAVNSGNIIVIVGWVAQTFLQLVLLSIIMVGQDIQDEKSEKRTEHMLKHISDDNDRILDELKKIVSRR